MCVDYSKHLHHYVYYVITFSLTLGNNIYSKGIFALFVLLFHIMKIIKL